MRSWLIFGIGGMAIPWYAMCTIVSTNEFDILQFLTYDMIVLDFYSLNGYFFTFNEKRSVKLGA